MESSLGRTGFHSTDEIVLVITLMITLVKKTLPEAVNLKFHHHVVHPLHQFPFSDKAVSFSDQSKMPSTIKWIAIHQSRIMDGFTVEMQRELYHVVFPPVRDKVIAGEVA